jgi:hypothetical protein
MTIAATTSPKPGRRVAFHAANGPYADNLSPAGPLARADPGAAARGRHTTMESVRFGGRFKDKTQNARESKVEGQASTSSPVPGMWGGKHASYPVTGRAPTRNPERR